jgi:large subunit ribosomal protein L31
MKSNIHPEYSEIKATCGCGNTLAVMSTLKDDLSLDICSACHPGGRVQRFEERFGKKK